MAAALAWAETDRTEPGTAARAAQRPLPAPERGCDRRIQSAAFFAADSRGRPLAALRPDTPRPVASIAKLMTARVALRGGSPGRGLTVPELRLAPDESQARLRAGERIDRAALLRLLLVPSANDAAETLAAAHPAGRVGFVRAMNRMARRLGLRRTRYVNPTGMPAPGQRSTARESVALARAAMADARIRRIVRRRDTRHAGRTFGSTNDLLGRVPGVDGVKTGHVAGDWSIVASATGKGGRVWVSVLGAPREDVRDRDAHCLLAHARRLVARAAPG
jgi:D-alanyl-D-alanine carboxypeptidase (penicillin-binding protein 5/6)